MGRYIDWADVTGRYPDAAKIAGAEAIGSYWLNYAEAEVDARLAPRFTTPFSSAPDMVKDVAIDLTYYRLTMRQKGAEVIKGYVDERINGMISGTLYLTSSFALENTTAWSEQAKTGYHSAFGFDNEIYWRNSSSFLIDEREKRGQNDIY